jgi:hypothetical protein
MKKKPQSRFAELLQSSKGADTATPRPRAQDEAGKRARGHIQISALIPPEVRDDVKVGLALDPERRDLSELITDLLNAWLDSLPENVQRARLSKQKSKK